MNANEARAQFRASTRTPLQNDIRKYVDRRLKEVSVFARVLVDPLKGFEGPVSREDEHLLWQELREDGFLVQHNYQNPLAPFSQVTTISW